MKKKHKKSASGLDNGFWKEILAQSTKFGEIFANMYAQKAHIAVADVQEADSALEKYTSRVKEAEASIKSCQKVYNELLASVEASDKAIKAFLVNYEEYKKAMQEMQMQSFDEREIDFPN